MGDIDVLFELGALIPSIGLGFLFWLIWRAIMHGDRLQREAEREAEREYLQEHSSPAEKDGSN